MSASGVGVRGAGGGGRPVQPAAAGGAGGGRGGGGGEAARLRHDEGGEGEEGEGVSLAPPHQGAAGPQEGPVYGDIVCHSYTTTT